jgi:putative transposase
MKDDSKMYHRRSIRLKEYDYTQNAAYFITICVQNKDCLLGEIVDDNSMNLNTAGKMIATQWRELQKRFQYIQLDEHVVMPNHFHGIIFIVNDDVNNNAWAPTRGAPTIGNIIGAFKSITTHKYITGVKNNNWQSFDKKLWQRNYYEHIIRNEISLEKIREYIVNNPYNWAQNELFIKI